MTDGANPLTVRASNTAVVGTPAVNVPAATVRVFVDALERLGYEVEPLLATVGIRRADLTDPDARVSCTVLPTICCAAARERPIPNLAAQLASKTPIGAFPLLDYLVITSETVAAGIRQLSRYLRIAEAPYTLDPKTEEDLVRVFHVGPPNAFAMEYAVTLNVLHLREETNGKLEVISLSLVHSPDDVSGIEKLIGCPVVTKADWNGFVLPRTAWEMPLRRRDPILRSVLEQHAANINAKIPETDILAREVRRVLASRMAAGDTEIESVARTLATSTRSLQRRLAGAGFSYQQLLDNTRRDAAREYLSDARLSISEVAYLVGYSEPAAFIRAFKRWNGVSPQAFRKTPTRPQTH